MKVMYTRPEDGGVSIVIAAPRADIEKVIGPLTQEQYEQHVMERSIPVGALRVKAITAANIPNDREFRNAWVDTTDDNNVNIDVSKVKEIKLQELRKARNAKLALTDIDFTIALEFNDYEKLADLKIKRARLRDATEALKAIQADGVVDDANMLKLIRQKAVLD